MEEAAHSDSDGEGSYVNFVPDVPLAPSKSGTSKSKTEAREGDDNNDDEDDYLTPVGCDREEAGDHTADTLERGSQGVFGDEDDIAALVELLLTCLGCGRKLTNPKLLLCRHTLCLACVKGGVKNSTTVTCWACHKSQPLPPGGLSELSASPTFATLLGSEVKDTTSGSTSTCGVCEEARVAEKFCPTCDVSMCAPCARSHSKFKETKKHDLLPPKSSTLDPLSLVTSRQQVTCHKHDEHVDSFCQTCGVMTCSVCYQEQHKDHPRDLASSKVHRVKKVKADLLTSIKRSLRASRTHDMDVERFGQDVRTETEVLTRELRDYLQRITRHFNDRLEEMSKVVQEEGAKAEGVAKRLTEDCKNRQDTLKLLKILMVRLEATNSMSEVDTQILTAFCKRKYSNITTGQEKELSKRVSRHFRPSNELVRALLMPSVGTVVRVGSYPKITTPTVRKTLEICADPSGMAVTPFGEFLCASYMNKSLSLYSPAGALIRDISCDVGLPWGTGITMDGLLLVTECDTAHARPCVKVFSPAGTYLRSFGSGVLGSVTGLALTPDGEVAVCDENGPSLVVFRMDGSTAKSYKMDALHPDRYLFEGPMHIAVNVNRDLVVCDDHRIIKIVTSEGSLRAQFPEVQAPSHQNRHFEGLCTDRKGQIIVADSGRNGLHVLTMEGKDRSFVPLPDDLTEPMFVVVTPDNKLAVATRLGKLGILDFFEETSS